VLVHQDTACDAVALLYKHSAALQPASVRSLDRHGCPRPV